MYHLIFHSFSSGVSHYPLLSSSSFLYHTLLFTLIFHTSLTPTLTATTTKWSPRSISTLTHCNNTLVLASPFPPRLHVPDPFPRLRLPPPLLRRHHHHALLLPLLILTATTTTTIVISITAHRCFTFHQRSTWRSSRRR